MQAGSGKYNQRIDKLNYTSENFISVHG